MAISELHRLARELNAAGADNQPIAKGRLLAVAGLMGLLQQDPEQWFTLSRGGDDFSAEQVEALIAKRNQAKADKDYAGADAVREELKSLGVVLEDSREGTKWRRE